MRIPLFVAVLLASMVFGMFTSPATAADWSWNSLNPFAEKTKSKKKSPSHTTRAQSHKEPSLLSRMSKSTKSMAKKTTDTLTFKKKKTPTKPSDRFSPNLGSKSKKAKKESSSFSFGNWFSGDGKDSDGAESVDGVKESRLE